MISAFSVLIGSTPDHSMLGSASNLDDLLPVIGAEKPDVFLVYLVCESRGDKNKSPYEVISRIKVIYPESLCVTIVKYISQIEKVRKIGADLALIDGVSAEKLLAAIEGKGL